MSQQYPGLQPPIPQQSDSSLPPQQLPWNQQPQGQSGQTQWGQQPQQPFGQPQWNQQQPMYQPQQPMMPPPAPKKKSGLKRVLIVLGIVLVLVVASCAIINSVVNSVVKQTTAGTISTGSTPNNASTPATTSPRVVRQVKGKATTLGAGTFSGGKDVPAGLYNVAASSGQTGNFIVSGTDSYNDILGQGVTKIRAQISDGDQIQLSGLSSVTFTPVSTPFITTHTPVTLFAGTFIVGQDIGAGRYVATTTAGNTGNFIVSGANSANEILGQNGMGGVPSVTTDLADGDVISISGLGQVIMTPK